MALVRVGPVRIAISALAPFRPPGWGSVGCRTFVELNLSGALDARHHQGDWVSVSGGLCQRCGTAQSIIYGAVVASTVMLPEEMLRRSTPQIDP